MGLKDKLAKASRATVTAQLRVGNVTAAQATLAAAQADGDPDRVKAATAAVGACYEPVVLTALHPAQMETLLGKHPPTDEQRERSKREQKTQPMFNPDTFVPALLAASIESDMTEDDWAEYTTTGAMTAGEVADLFSKAWELNYRVPDVDLKKG